MGDGETSPPRGRVIASLGFTQILAWGSSYYLLTVLAPWISKDAGWPLSLVIGGLSLGLLVAGVVSPYVGNLILRFGGRPVLSASAVFLGGGLLLMAVAPNLFLYFLAWSVIGLGMGAGLYDAAFSALGRDHGDAARGAITALTLFGGFASTICWPLSAVLVEHLGWRSTCAVYAGLQLFISLPLYHSLPLPSPRPNDTTTSSRTNTAVRPQMDRLRFTLLAVIFTLTAFSFTLLSVHLLTLLQLRGFTLATAVYLGALIGPTQVAARVVEKCVGRFWHPVWALALSTFLMAAGLSLLNGMSAVGVALVVYGAGNGLISIARGTVPLAIFGPEIYPVMVGRLALPSLVTQALTPSIGTILLERTGASSTLTILSAAVLAAFLLALCLAVREKRLPN